MAEPHPLFDWMSRNLLLPATCCFMLGATLAGLYTRLSALSLLLAFVLLAGGLFILY